MQCATFADPVQKRWRGKSLFPRSISGPVSMFPVHTAGANRSKSLNQKCNPRQAMATNILANTVSIVIDFRLPCECERIQWKHLAHCYRPAEAVGGDFFDIFPLSPSRVGVFICNVMGHGLRAALITAVIRTLLEELRPLMDNPRALFKRAQSSAPSDSRACRRAFHRLCLLSCRGCCGERNALCERGTPGSDPYQAKRSDCRTPLGAERQSWPWPGTI